MRQYLRCTFRQAILAGAVVVAAGYPVLAGDRSPRAEDAKVDADATKQADAPKPIDLLTASRNGQVKVSATGTGDANVSLTMTNRTRLPLRIVLPPGLTASSATSQVGSLGGGFGRNRGILGGHYGDNQTQGFVNGKTEPPAEGLLMIGQAIKITAGDPDSWAPNTLLAPLNIVMNGVETTGQFGTGMGFLPPAGGQNGGFRSVPATGLSFMDLKPEETSTMVTQVVSFRAPVKSGKASMPSKGERLTLGDFDELSHDPLARAALRRLADDKAPPILAQLVMWHLGHGISWDRLRVLSNAWASEFDRALAMDFVDRLRADNKISPTMTDESGTIHFALGAGDGKSDAELRELLLNRPMLGLTPSAGIPENPSGPSVAVRVVLEDAVARVEFSTSSAKGKHWESRGKLSLPLHKKSEPLTPDQLADTLADALLQRLTDVSVIDGKTIDDKTTHVLRVVNNSPLILSGLSLIGTAADAVDATSGVLSGISLPPGRTALIPVDDETLDRLSLKSGVRFFAADFSAL